MLLEALGRSTTDLERLPQSMKDITYSPKCTSIKGLKVSIRWCLECLKRYCGWRVLLHGYEHLTVKCFWKLIERLQGKRAFISKIVTELEMGIDGSLSPLNLLGRHMAHNLTPLRAQSTNIRSIHGFCNNKNRNYGWGNCYLVVYLDRWAEKHGTQIAKAGALLGPLPAPRLAVAGLCVGGALIIPRGSKYSKYRGIWSQIL